MDKFSVLMAVYKNDVPLELHHSLDSIFLNTVIPYEVVIIVDGPIGVEIQNVINIFSVRFNLVVKYLEENQGLANALKIGIPLCSCDLIARMDSDDICRADRFRLQLDIFNSDSGIDIVGGWIEEFSEAEDKQIRKTPEYHDDIVKFAKFRSPINHVSVMFKKQAVLKAGNYPQFRGIEDYPLWVNMIMTQCKFYNIQVILVDVRAGQNMILRRSGYNYAKTEYAMIRNFYNINFISRFEFFYISVSKFFIRICPKSILSIAYKVVRKLK